MTGLINNCKHFFRIKDSFCSHKDVRHFLHTAEISRPANLAQLRAVCQTQMSRLGRGDEVFFFFRNNKKDKTKQFFFNRKVV